MGGARGLLYIVVLVGVTACAAPPRTASHPRPAEAPNPDIAPARPTVVGTASWYGAFHHGRRTGSGEVFDMHALTAAHRTLPLGTRVRVTNLWPDRAAMRAVIMPAIETARGAGYAQIRGFGEMVDILNRRGNLAAAIRLEELWNDLLEAERIALLCAYAIDPFDRAEYRQTLPSIGHMHSHMMPVEDSERLERAIDRAFIDVFGIYGDTRLLREFFVRQLPDGTAMRPGRAVRPSRPRHAPGRRRARARRHALPQRLIPRPHAR